VLRLHDDLGRTLEGLRRREDLELTPERFFTAFEQFREELELILGQHGVAPFRNPADAFDPGRQRAVSTVPTDDPARVGWIAGRRRPGFERGGEVLCKERVVVYALSRKRDATAQGADGSCGEPAATPNGGAA
jgi:molecular chaperone GrpE (heat shock protein)